MAAIDRGETPDSCVHNEVNDGKIALEIDKFRLFYGEKQAILMSR